MSHLSTVRSVLARAAVGMRVVLLGHRSEEGGGVIVSIRNEPWLRPFEILLDSGRRVYVSAAHLARELDADRTPLGPALHDD